MRCCIVFFLVLVLFFSCDNNQRIVTTARDSVQHLTQYVDPYIGSSFHGHVFVGASVPFGAVQLGPTQLSEGWDWCSGYHYSDSVIIGFSHTHLSGTGIGDLGDIMLMPATGEFRFTKGTVEKPESGFGSKFTHDEEKVKPGYYSVVLKRYGIEVELTSSTRVGFHRYKFTNTDDAYVLIDLRQGIGWDAPYETHMEFVNDSTLTGYRYSKGWAEDQRIFFSAVFSKPIREFSVAHDGKIINEKSSTGKDIKGYVRFDKAAKEVLVKVGISPVSVENAMMNITAEIPHWDFDKVVEDADSLWNKELNKVQVNADKHTLRNFYTALYHTMIAPSVFNDVNGDYRGSDKKIYNDTTFTNLTTFSLWDTYRSAHSLHTILNPERVNDMVNTMLRIYEQQGKLPVWHLMGNETNTMPGNSAFPVIADAVLKGFNGFDANAALEAMKASALLDERGLKYVREKGYIPADLEVESVAKGLEYAIDDWCIAQVAKKLGREDDYTLFSKRAKYYRNYFDPETRFVRGRISDDKWRTPFSPFIVKHMKDDFAEGNAWQYTWLVPQDVEGLMELLGGEQRFIEKLDSLFIVKGDLGKEASADITGLIGQYAHGNEPSHHITYLYGYTQQPWKTAPKVRYILDSLYSDKPDGLCGNEDVGQMSAWYVFSALGFYPANPANGMYVFGSPAIENARLQVGVNNYFDIKVKNNSAANIYIQRISLNGKPYNKTWLPYTDIMKGGTLEIEMGEEPNKQWGTEKAFSGSL
ncbi:GH92 family glycosyl hydrolase [Chryseosolibacter indicus]|uniref:GH92 family glycosyl hydrolase n=1 Tax=Chryseosolibacter indicus TaxID=2782351 RepID=A0ABS5VVP8_9BACT|nr:GH92 family glycosyl hydrolase [Chryseosolibacter indicus]MBT1704071.1 GH92 family glycosyl hydrolase [Chryseosolibacter indicus]